MGIRSVAISTKSSKCPFRAMVLLVLFSIFSPSLVAGHPDDDFSLAQMTIYRWASGFVNDESKVIRATLSDHYTADDRTSVILGYALSGDARNTVTQVFLDHAKYELIGDDVRVSPILMYYNNGGYKSAWTLVLSKKGNNWKIKHLSFQPQSDFSAELSDMVSLGDLPEQFETAPVSISLRDAIGPVYARVHIADDSGEYWPPRGHQKNIYRGWREDVGGDVRIAETTYAYVEPEFVVDLPPGNYRITAVKGMEYEPTVAEFEVTSSKVTAVPISLNRWIDMRSKGWYAGDTHTHFLDDQNALLEIAAEDLSVINILAAKWGEVITDAHRIVGQPSSVSMPQHIVYVNEEARHHFLGHTILHGIEKPIYPLSWGGPHEGVTNGGDYPPMAHLADEAHAQDGIVTWAHLNPGLGRELPIDVALGKIDSVDVFTWGNAFRPPTNFDESESTPTAIKYWYKFLNTGFRLPATGGTDKMYNTQVVGSVRTYAYLGDTDLTYDGWINAISQGRTFVTTGPMLSFRLDDQNIGAVVSVPSGTDVTVEAEVSAPFERYPWLKLDIVHSGEVIASYTNDTGQDKAILRTRVKIHQSAWFAARVYVPDRVDLPLVSESGMNAVPAMAHTSPIYVDVAGTKVWSKADAEFLARVCDIAIDWAKNRAHYFTAEERNEVVSLFEKARAIYAVP